MPVQINEALSESEIQHFEEEGFLVFERLLPEDRRACYESVFDELIEQSRNQPIDTPHFSYEKDENDQQIPGFLHKIQGVCVVDPRILELATEPEILARLETLLGPNLDIFGTKFFPKLPSGGTSVRWHQDNFYFGTQSNRIVSCAIYLQDSDKENGCLRLVPRSHLTGSIAEHKNEKGRYGSWVDVDETNAIDVECPGGTAVIFSANLMHGAHDNTSDRSRYSTAWHYVPGDLALDRFPRVAYRDRHIVLGE